MKRHQAVVYPFVILIFIKLLFIIGFFSNLENKAQDQLFRMRGPIEPSNEVVVVGIDDDTFSALDTRWPFARSVHAKLIDNLKRAGARLIVMDIEFTESGIPEEDLALAESAARAGNVVFAGKLVQGAGRGIHLQSYEPIEPITQRGTVWGFVNINKDPDGVMRKYTCRIPFGDKKDVHTLGIAALANYRYYQQQWADHIKVEKGRLKVIDKSIPLTNATEALINFRGPSGSLPYRSYVSILDDAQTPIPGYGGVELDEFEEILASGELKGKIVLVGAHTAELHDDFATPFSSKNWTHGVEVHASFLDMVMKGDYLYQVNFWAMLLLELLIALLLWFVLRKLKPQYGVMLVVLLIALYLVLAWFMFMKASLIIPIVQMLLLFIFIYVASIVSHYLATLKEKRFIKNAFQQYMAPGLVNELLKDPKSLKYGGSLQEITVLFSDIRSFTTYSEKHQPEETVQILKEYLTAMVNVVLENGGILDKFVGDAIMALYGTPVKLPNAPLSACKTALEMRERLTELQIKWREEGHEEFEIGIGVTTGPAVVGNLGSEQIFDYTAIGDTINLGARLESLNKDYNAANHIIISEFTYEQVKDFVEASYLDDVKVKGKDITVKIYELISLK